MNNQSRRLFLFDMDSTLINEEVIDLLASKAGVAEDVEEITSKAMNGQLDFGQSLRARVKLLAGLAESELESVRTEISLTKGAEQLITFLQKRGEVIGVVSGGFTYVIQPILEKLGVTHYRANTLEIENGYLTGNLIGELIDRAAKAKALVDFAAANSIEISRTVAVGDGANDIDMIKAAGIGIAFCAKPALQEVADKIINNRDLLEILSLVD